MRKVRELAENVWYLINTSANNGELCRRSGCGFDGERAGEGGMRSSCAGCGCTVSFFIKPANGLQLPDIMKCRCAV
jgi:hypothetical protein